MLTQHILRRIGIAVRDRLIDLPVLFYGLS